KTEEEARVFWAENRLTTACRRGYTLIYDEFTRSRPEANNALLAVLSEGILPLPPVAGDDQGYLRVHPQFSAIFTSNPAEYAATHKTQDALRDRLVTLHLSTPDPSTQAAVVEKRSGLGAREAGRIVELVGILHRELAPKTPVSLRGLIGVARLMAHRREPIASTSRWLRWACVDLLAGSLQGELAAEEFAGRVESILEAELGTAES
ncbi:MAG: AAA family ATPase, partial [Acidobacteriota bacterium]